MIVPGVIRRARLQALMARHLVNWRETWRAYAGAAPMPSLRFRNGLVFEHRARDSAGLLFFEIFGNGCYRRGSPRRLAGDVLDIGANIGGFTVDAARRYPAAIVHAYEPDPETCGVLRRNVEVNGLSSRVRIWNEAVAGKAGALTLWRGEGSVLATTHESAATAAGERCTVPAVTLRTALERTSGRVGLLKMDAEGAEAEIFEAAAGALDAVDCIVAEYHRWLVPDVVPRIERVLEGSFQVTVSDGGRCGPLLRARRDRGAGGS